MTKRKKKSFFKTFLSNLSDPVIKILLGALIINLLFVFRSSDWIECVGIGISVFLATLISTMSEYTSENAFAWLEAEYALGKAKVIREGELREISAEEIVVGDIVYLCAGEQIPADGEVLYGSIFTDQSAMTGESREVEKCPRQSSDNDTTPASPYFCFRGCTVISGSAYMRVCKVGDNTFLGGISSEVQSENSQSPLKERLSRLAKQISIFGYVAAVLIAAVFLFKCFVIDSAFDREIVLYKLKNLPFLFEKLMSALTLGLTVIVVAVPEGLPMMIAVVLSSNIKRMVKNNVLVRKPVGIESAGSMNILFTDKTGTLTEGRLCVGRIYGGDGRMFRNISELESDEFLFCEYASSAIHNSESHFGRDSAGNWGAIGGNSTDRAILDSLKGVREKSDGYVTDKIPFDSDLKFSAAKVIDKNTTKTYIKGAPEVLLPYLKRYLCNGKFKPISPSAIKKICDRETAQGKRVLAIAVSSADISLRDISGKRMPELSLICLVVLEDGLRDTASESVNKLQQAGIGIVMITGDNKDTAVNIARECGIYCEERNIALTSAELSSMSDAQITEILPRLCVLARALPQDKSRLVRLSQKAGLVVGMTGDGVNDAPALKAADVGFSMGSGVQVAKDAGDIIILDNDLSSIVKAVKYGRNIFKSIRKFITLQLMMNFCAVGVSMICPFLGINSPVTVVQMLWINIIMDTLGGLAFAGEPALESCMQEAPKRRDEQILNSYMVNEIVFLGGFTIALYLFFLKCPYITSLFRYEKNNLYLLTAFFALFIFSSVFNCFNARTDRVKLFAGLSKNRAFILIMSAVMFIQILFIYLGGPVLRTLPLTLKELGITFLLSLTVFPAELLRKCVLKMVGKKKGY